MTETTTKEIHKDAWQWPLTRTHNERYAPNEADCFYAADRNFRRWLRTNVNHLMTGWDEELHDKPGFLGFCKWAQLQFLDHMRGMAMTVLSFSMFTLYGQRAIDEWRAPQGSPTVALVERFTAKVAGLWDRAEEMTDSAITFYQMQTGETAPRPAAETAEGAR